MSRARIVWSSDERAAVAKAARALVEKGEDPVRAYNKVQAQVLPESRHRMASAPSNANTEVMAEIMGAGAGAEAKAKAAADLAAAEALLAEASAANEKIRAAIAERDARIVELERRLESTMAETARMTDEGAALADAISGLVRRVMAEQQRAAPPPPPPDVEVEAPVSRAAEPPPAETIAAAVAHAFGGNGGEDAAPPRPAAPYKAPVYKPRILIVCGANEPTKSDTKWRHAFPTIDLRIERAHQDGSMAVPRNQDAAILVKGVRHTTSEIVRHEYHGAPLCMRRDVPRVLTSILSRIRGH